MNLDLLNSIASFLPEIVLVLIMILIPLNNAFFEKYGIKIRMIAISGIGISLFLSVIQIFSIPIRIFGTMSVLDPLSTFANIAISFSALMIVLITTKTETEQSFEVERYVFVSALTLGCMLLASSVNLLMLFVSAALIDLSLILLMSLKLSPPLSGTLNFKLYAYNLMSSLIMLIGVSILYGIAGSMDYYSISAFLSVHPFNSTTLLLAALLILTGFASKMLLAPFHIPLSKIISSSSLPVFGMIICPIVISAFISSARFFVTIFQSAHLAGSNSLSYPQTTNFYWNLALIILALIAIAFSSIAILTQTKLRKILLYFTIAQSSILIFGLSTVSKAGLASALALAISFCLTFPGLLYFVNKIENNFKSDDIDELAGQGQSNKWIFAGLIILLMSLAGLPITVGFTSRLFVYSALAGYVSIWITVILILNSLILSFVCFKIFRNVFLREALILRQKTEFPGGGKLILLIILLPAILIGSYFEPIMKMAEFFCQIYGIR